MEISANEALVFHLLAAPIMHNVMMANHVPMIYVTPMLECVHLCMMEVVVTNLCVPPMVV